MKMVIKKELALVKCKLKLNSLKFKTGNRNKIMIKIQPKIKINFRMPKPVYELLQRGVTAFGIDQDEIIRRALRRHFNGTPQIVGQIPKNKTSHKKDTSCIPYSIRIDAWLIDRLEEHKNRSRIINLIVWGNLNTELKKVKPEPPINTGGLIEGVHYIVENAE